MTNFWQEKYDKRIEEFSNFLSDKNITQTKAAEMLDISRGQLSHLLKYERTLNEFIYDRMKFIMENKVPQKTGGIYGIYYKNNLIYIGQTKNFNNRFYAHKSAIKNCTQDNQPFHQSNLDVNFLAQKILYSCETKFLYPQEINRLEDLFIRICLPEWNTNIATLSAIKKPQEEKINELINLHSIHLNLLQYELTIYNLPITEEGNNILKMANDYSTEEIAFRAEKIISNNKSRITMTVKEYSEIEKDRGKRLNQKLKEQYFKKYGEYPPEGSMEKFGYKE